jgi:hypothetical protein
VNTLQAVQLLAEGHSIVAVQQGREICAALSLQFPEQLVLSWSGSADAFARYGFYTADAPGSGVDVLSLSYEVCRQVGIQNPPGYRYHGVGKQAQENSRAIAQVLSRQGVL